MIRAQLVELLQFIYCQVVFASDGIQCIPFVHRLGAYAAAVGDPSNFVLCLGLILGRSLGIFSFLRGNNYAFLRNLQGMGLGIFPIGTIVQNQVVVFVKLEILYERDKLFGVFSVGGITRLLQSLGPGLVVVGSQIEKELIASS